MCLRHVSALRAHKTRGFIGSVLSTTFAKGEYIADKQRLSISHLQSKYISLVCEHSSQTSISRERSEPKGDKKMNESTYKALANKCGLIRRRLIASITTAKENS